MKKIFLFALIVAGATASFAQTNAAQKPVQNNNPAPTLRQAQEARANNAPATRPATTTANTRTAPTTKATNKASAPKETKTR